MAELLNAFLYGSYLLHNLTAVWPKYKKLFRDIYDTLLREQLLFELHMSLKLVHNHVSSVAAVLYQDFAAWSNGELVPRPDLMWHKDIFIAPSAPKPATEGT